MSANISIEAEDAYPTSAPGPFSQFFLFLFFVESELLISFCFFVLCYFGYTIYMNVVVGTSKKMNVYFKGIHKLLGFFYLVHKYMHITKTISASSKVVWKLSCLSILGRILHVLSLTLNCRSIKLSKLYKHNGKRYSINFCAKRVVNFHIVQTLKFIF